MSPSDSHSRLPQLPADDFGCPYCDTPPCRAFGWQRAQARTQEQWHQIFIHLELAHTLKLGWVYRCTNCRQPWYVDAEKRQGTRVSPGTERQLLEWGSRDVRPTPEQQAVLIGIGASSYWATVSRRDNLFVPCRLSLGSEFHDPVVIVISHEPPSFRGRPYELLAPGAVLGPSAFALPLDVRRATSCSPEVANGLAPTRVQTASGRRFT